MNADIYDVILFTAGLFFGQIVCHTLIYRFIHPYIVVPYFNRKKELKQNNWKWSGEKKWQQSDVQPVTKKSRI